MMNKNAYTKEQAIERAYSYANLTADEKRCTDSGTDGDVYYFEVRTPYQIYEFYVDANTCEVLGMSAEPAFDHEMIYAQEADSADDKKAA